MTEHLLGLELAHWLIIAGLALVVLGSLGMVVRRRKQPESPTPGEATSVDEPGPDAMASVARHRRRTSIR
jgi:LPXTG-motif cell wall-anchored protein